MVRSPGDSSSVTPCQSDETSSVRSIVRPSRSTRYCRSSNSLNVNAADSPSMSTRLREAHDVDVSSTGADRGKGHRRLGLGTGGEFAEGAPQRLDEHAEADTGCRG